MLTLSLRRNGKFANDGPRHAMYRIMITIKFEPPQSSLEQGGFRSNSLRSRYKEQLSQVLQTPRRHRSC